MEENVTNEEIVEETPVEEEVNPQLEKLKERIPYDEVIFGTQENYEKVLLNLLEDSKNIALEEIYPFRDFYEMELPKKYLNWQLRACVEIFNLADKNGIISYSENGLSFSRMEDGISSDLLDELIPKAGKLKRTEEEGETK